mmetsp:Transcript_26729/g.50896  ORF Transcript_26729/g.50896 Transcript_26729/m.50896 type:complete len:475 (-) Transcript_26729:188-1612(-)
MSKTIRARISSSRWTENYANSCRVRAMNFQYTHVGTVARTTMKQYKLHGWENEKRSLGRSWLKKHIVRSSGAPELMLDDVKVLKLVGSMAVQTVQEAGKLSLEQPQVQATSGAVNFYLASLDMGKISGLTCRLLLKEYPRTTRDLGLNEIRIYDHLYGQNTGPPFNELINIVQAMDDGDSFSTAVPIHAPRMYACFDAVLSFEQEGAGPRLLPAPSTDADEAWGRETSTWLAFRFGEHGTSTLVDFSVKFQQEVALQAEEAARRQSTDIGEDFTIGSVLSILMPFERVPVTPADSFGRYARMAMKGAIQSLAWVHSRDVYHGSLSGACILVNSLNTDVNEKDFRVSLMNFGYSTTPELYEPPDVPPDLLVAARRAGAVTSEAIAEYARRDDVFQLGMAFAQLMFPNLLDKGTDLKKLIVDIFECDMLQLAEYSQVDDPIGHEVLSANNGAGWELLASMLTRRCSAQGLLQSRYF